MTQPDFPLNTPPDDAGEGELANAVLPPVEGAAGAAGVAAAPAVSGCVPSVSVDRAPWLAKIFSIWPCQVLRSLWKTVSM